MERVCDVGIDKFTADGHRLVKIARAIAAAEREASMSDYISAESVYQLLGQIDSLTAERDALKAQLERARMPAMLAARAKEIAVIAMREIDPGPSFESRAIYLAIDVAAWLDQQEQ